MKSAKKSKQERALELRNDGFKKKSGGVDYERLVDKRLDDKRHEREKAYKLQQQQLAAGTAKTEGAAPSSTLDALHRMASGKESRTLAEKIADPNRPTWEQYKKDNEDKLDNIGQEVRKMAEYRAQLDREREERLAQSVQNVRKRRMEQNSDSDEDDDSEDSDDSNRKSKKKKRSSSKKEKKSKKDKKKKHKKKKRAHSSDGSGSGSAS